MDLLKKFLLKKYKDNLEIYDYLEKNNLNIKKNQMQKWFVYKIISGFIPNLIKITISIPQEAREKIEKNLDYELTYNDKFYLKYMDKISNCRR